MTTQITTPLMAMLHKSMVPGRERGLLGRKQPDPSVKMLQLAHYFDMRVLPPAPTTADYVSRINNWPMFLNDRLGCCVPTGAAHWEQVFTVYAGSAMDLPVDEDVLIAYEQVGGYRPGDAATDQGCMLTDMLKWWMKNKMSHYTISAWGSISTGDTNIARLTIAYLGGAYVGINLSQKDLDDFDAGRAWSDTGPGDPSFGHCVLSPAFTPLGPVVITWGKAQQCTWDWWHYRVGDPRGEAYGVIHPTWMNAAHIPSGLEIGTFLEDFTLLTGIAAPIPTPIIPPNPVGKKTFSFIYDLATGKPGPVTVR